MILGDGGTPSPLLNPCMIMMILAARSQTGLTGMNRKIVRFSLYYFCHGNSYWVGPKENV
jgi:hypothetical protein